MPRQVRRQVRPHGDGADAGTAAAVRDAEGLVQVQMGDIAAELAGIAKSHHGVQVGAVDVDLAAMLMDDSQISVMASSNTPCVEG